MFTWTKLLVWIPGLFVLLSLETMAGTIVSPTPADKVVVVDSTFSGESVTSREAAHSPSKPEETSRTNGIVLVFLIIVPVGIFVSFIHSPEFLRFMREIYFPEDY